MKNFLTIFILLATIQAISYYPPANSQRKFSQIKGNKKKVESDSKSIVVLNASRNKYQTQEKEKLIKLQKIKIQNIESELRYSIALGFIFLILSIIIIAYLIKRNKTYKRLFRKNITLVSEKQYSVENDLVKRKKDDISCSHNGLNYELKRSIITSLEYQIASRIFLEPDLSLKKLANKCGTNRTYLSQIIHEKYRMNFNNFINKYRIEEAKRILSDPENDIPLKALYERLGFSSYTRFSEAFKKSTDITPSYFLKKIGYKYHMEK